MRSTTAVRMIEFAAAAAARSLLFLLLALPTSTNLKLRAILLLLCSKLPYPLSLAKQQTHLQI